MRFAISSAIFVLITPQLFAQAREDEIVNSSTVVIREIMDVTLKSIPQSLLADAQGIVIIPNMLKGGFIVGVRHGHGVLVTRDKSGAWRAPLFVTITGGSVGWQAGVQATDLVLVFRTRRSVDGVLNNKFTIGADASVAAGPVGREASAATDSQLKAEILSYSRSRGLFAGIALDGAVMHVDHRSNTDYYNLRAGQAQVTTPPSGVALVQQIAAYASPKKEAVVTAVPRDVGPPPPVPVPDERETVRQQLVAAVQRLQPLLDQQWQQYLALPAEVFTGAALPANSSLEPYVRRYQAIAGEQRYRMLNDRPEFQETLTLLRRYAGLTAVQSGTITLPPPPPR